MLILSSKDIRSLVSVEDCVRAARTAFTATSAGLVSQPQRLTSEDGSTLAMLGEDKATLEASLKVVSIRPSNIPLGLEALQSAVLLVDATTGVPSALLEGKALTALRTGAASGLATDLLAPTAATCLAVVGAGGQARDQIRSVCAVRPIRMVHIYSRTAESKEALAREMADAMPDVSFLASDSVEAAVRDAEVICTATNSRAPFLSPSGLLPNVHVNAIGAHTREMSELEPSLLERAALVAVDQVEAALAEGGDVIHAVEAGRVSQDDLIELGLLLDVDLEPFRAKLTIFKSVGIAAQDLALASLVVNRAVDQRVGSHVALD